MAKKIGVVVPTLFDRPQYLIDCIRSIRESGDAYILLMGPLTRSSEGAMSLVDQFLAEPDVQNLSAKINRAIENLPECLEFVTWIGDDDLLEPGGLEKAAAFLEREAEVSMVFGACRYIDHLGNEIFVNSVGRWAVPLMEVGPFLLPQPGSVIRRTDFTMIGGLSEDLKLAFDYQLALSLSRVGELGLISDVLASYRWHPDALSVRLRLLSVLEANTVRIRLSKPWLVPLNFVLSPIVGVMTLLAGKVLNLRLALSKERQAQSSIDL